MSDPSITPDQIRQAILDRLNAMPPEDLQNTAPSPIPHLDGHSQVHYALRNYTQLFECLALISKVLGNDPIGLCVCPHTGDLRAFKVAP